MPGSNRTTLVFLGTCLAFAEGALALLAGLEGAQPTIVAGFALAALGLVLAALVTMYWRDPAFLTLSGSQALDLRRLEAVLQNMPPELIPVYIRGLTEQDLVEGEYGDIEEGDETQEDEALSIDEGLRALLGEE